MTVPSTSGITAEEDAESFPDTDLFQRLVELANQHLQTPKIIINDGRLGITANCVELLTDVQHLRAIVLNDLPEAIKAALYDDQQDVFIALAALGGYEWVVAYLAILSIGAAAVPISPYALQSEISSLVSTTDSVAILFSSLAADSVRSFQSINDSDSLSDSIVKACRPIPITLTPSPLNQLAGSFRISKRPFSLDVAGSVFFTSGSTGPRSGIIHARRITMQSPSNSIPSGLSFVYNSASHWIGGVLGQIIPILAGGSVEYPSKWTASWMWQRLRSGEVSGYAGLVQGYSDLSHYYQDHISCLPEDEKEKYHRGLAHLQVPMIGGSPLLESLRMAWDGIPGSRPLINVYGCTECPNIGIMPITEGFPANCIGQPRPNLEVKLSEGDKGEILVRSPTIFLRYLKDPGRTADSFDEDGFYKTGDYGRWDGSHYFCHGRISQDLIKANGAFINAPEVENAILQLPFVLETMVVRVVDQFGERIGAIVRPHQQQYADSTSTEDALSLAWLRGELYSKGLSLHRLPSVLCVVDPSEELPRSPVGKPAKREASRIYFPEDCLVKGSDRIQVWSREQLEEDSKKYGDGEAMWDWKRYAREY